MSRVIDRAPLAVTSNGAVLLNVARFDVPMKIAEIVRMALRQRGAIFIGVALSPTEVKRLLDEAAMILPNVTGPMEALQPRKTASGAVSYRVPFLAGRFADVVALTRRRLSVSITPGGRPRAAGL